MGFWDWLMGTPEASPVAIARKGGPSAAARRASVFNLQVGDAISYDDVDYLVTNKYTYTDDGFSWYDYLLADSTTGDQVWLSVEDDDGLELALYREAELATAVPPVPKSVSHEGGKYRQIEHGRARVTVEREDPARTGQSEVEYWDFEGPDGRSLSIERWGNDHDVAAGTAIAEHALTIFPAVG